jgi:phosphoglycolate phosphatase
MEEALTALFPDMTAPRRDHFLARFRDHYLYLDNTSFDLFPGVPGGLTELTEAGYLLAIATGRPRRGLDRVLNQVGLQKLFVATRCADEATSKPHPRMLEEILTKTDMAPQQAIMIGDTVYDLQMAHNAGVDALAVSYGVHQRERLLEEGPVACVDSFGEVCAWLR